MKKELKVAIIVVGITAIVIAGFLGYEVWQMVKNNQQADDQPRTEIVSYRMVYYDNGIPGSKYEITVIDNRIEIKQTHFCSAVDCGEETVEEKKYNYSDENREKLGKFIDQLTNAHMDLMNLNADNFTEKQNDIMTGILLGEKFFELAIEEYQYKIEYSESDSVSYTIYFKEDESILVKKTTTNEDYDIVDLNTYAIQFNKDHMKMLNDYAKKEAELAKTSVIYKNATLYKDEKNIIRSIVENKEDYLEEQKAELSYTIEYNGINCLTPILRLYADNTYEFYDTYTTDGTPVVPKTGTYQYDLQKLIKNISKYPEDNIGPFVITDSDNHSYQTYSSNVELNELLKSISVSMTKCLEQAEGH